MARNLSNGLNGTVCTLRPFWAALHIILRRTMEGGQRGARTASDDHSRAKSIPRRQRIIKRTIPNPLFLAKESSPGHLSPLSCYVYENKMPPLS